MVDSPASEQIEGDAQLNPMFAGSPVMNSHSQSSSSALNGGSAIRKSPMFAGSPVKNSHSQSSSSSLNGGSAIRKRKEIIDFAAVADQVFHDADEEISQIEAEILEIDGGPGGPGGAGSPFKVRRNAAYTERDAAKLRLEFLTKDYDNVVQKATAEFERVIQDATKSIERADFRVKKANHFVEEVKAIFFRRKMLEEQLVLLKNKK